MSELCPFLKKRKGWRPSQKSGPKLDKVLVFLGSLSTMVVRAGIVTGDTHENLLLLVGFWLCSQKKGTRQPYSIGLD